MDGPHEWGGTRKKGGKFLSDTEERPRKVQKRRSTKKNGIIVGREHPEKMEKKKGEEKDIGLERPPSRRTARRALRGNR